MKKNLITASAIALAYSPLAISHPGHDHSHWAADSVHFITAASIVAAVAALAYAIKKASNKSKKEK